MINKNKRPIVFFNSVVHFGGSIKSTIALIKELKRSHEVIVLDGGGYCREYINALEEQGISYHIILPGAKRLIIGGNSRFIRLWRMLCASFEIRQIIKLLRRKLTELNPQIIWLNSEKSMFCVGRAAGKKYPTIIFIRSRVCALKWYCLRDWKNLGMIVANNSESLKFFQRFNWAKDKLAVAYNGIDFDAVQMAGPAPKDLPGRNASLKVVMPATLIPLKAHAIAIKGFAKFCQDEPDAVLWICGDTPNTLSLDYENSLHQLCHKLGVTDKVHFLGWRSNVPAITKVSDGMILTSETEGLPRSILEAMALGVPVISTRVGGVLEVIRDGKDGILIDSGDSNGVTKALLELKDPEFRQRITNSAMNRVKTDFTIEKQAKAFLACVDKIVSVKQKE